ncbi:MAG: CbiX/SirB N-terminal domain-containing protein [Paracoccus sp. (in: a-proteobacteria)]|nr:CbiX/SirB N-terminal domain-containing protein [Paracoccus sp. (in: a-proteobacteria)]
MAHRTEAVIVAHGQPGDPCPQQAAIEALAAQVGARLPEWRVYGATLAAEGALEAVAHPGALIYPFFMAEGWFTGRELPRRLAKAGAEGAQVLRPFGLDPALVALMQARAEAGAPATPGDCTLVLAAHGSQRSQTSADSARAMAAQMRGFRAVVTGFVEQAPYLADAAQVDGPALCLPFFALTADHVTQDIPEALAQAGFSGPLLPPIGAAPEVPALIAAALEAAHG